MYKGVCGIDALNTVLQNSFNPPSRSKKEVRAGFLTLREGDKILQLKNQPDDYVYNGDIGILEEILDARESEFNQTTLVVNFQDTYVYYTPDTFQNITLAYCISVHKSQGSEYPIVIMPISRQHHILLQKRLIYTAVTRSRRSLVLLGDREAFLEGVNTEERHVRNTSLKERLQQDALKIEKAGF